MRLNVDLKKIFNLSVILTSITINIFLGLIIYQKHSVRPVVKVESNLSPDAEKYSKYIELIRRYINSQEFVSESEKIDFVRNWIYKNSIHEIDSSYNLKDAFNTPKVLSMLWKSHEAKAKRVRLTCGPRAAAMKYILDKLHLKSRIVMIFTADSEQLASHTFLEVFNTESNKWETHDPDFNIFYIDKKTQDRIATFRLVFGDLNSLVPVSENGQGWKLNRVVHLKQHYFEAVMYGNPLTAKNPVILINTDKFNVNKIFKESGGVTFRQFANRHYNSPILIENRSLSRTACHDRKSIKLTDIKFDM